MSFRIGILTDGKPGHENQSYALAEAIQRRLTCEITCVSYKDWKNLEQPSLIISAGHKTHLPLIRARHHFKAKVAVLMKPSLPASFFDFVIAPRHDFPKGAKAKNIFFTEGMLCRLPEELPKKSNQTMILIGGPSKHFSWNHQKIMAQVEMITTEEKGECLITNSRRTPSETTKALNKYPFLPWEITPREWLPEQLAKSKSVWVTRDSMSMIYEALSSGAEVGLLDGTILRKETRITQSTESLIQSGRVKSFSNRQDFQPKIEPFHEAAKIADEIIPFSSY